MGLQQNLHRALYLEYDHVLYNYDVIDPYHFGTACLCMTEVVTLKMKWQYKEEKPFGMKSYVVLEHNSDLLYV